MHISENFSLGCLQSSSIRTNSVNTEEDTIKLVHNHQISPYLSAFPHIVFSLQSLAAWTLAVTSRREYGGWKNVVTPMGNGCAVIPGLMSKNCR